MSKQLRTNEVALCETVSCERGRMSGLICEITAYVAEDLARVDAHIKSVIDSDTSLVREVGDYVVAGQGKKLRPIMSLLASRVFGYRGEDSAKVAAALELVHTATLLHDDVIDKAALRRGRPTVNEKWGDDVAILIADYLYTNAFSMAMQALNPKVLSIICQVTAKMCEGEMFQIEKRAALLTREDYLRIIRHKTAYLFSACTGLGSILAKANETETALLTNFGLNFGIAFQITDDTLDLVSTGKECGKEPGADIRNGKQTLPIIHAFEVAEPADREDLWQCWQNGRESDRIMRHVHKYNSIEYSLGVAKQFAETAKQQLNSLQPSKALELITGLSDYVVQRTN